MIRDIFKCRVLHSPVNMAGQATLISRNLRQLGMESDVLVFNKHPFGYAHDISLELKERRSRAEKIVLILLNFIRCLRRYDIFHFHYGLTLLPCRIDLPLLKLFGKKVVMHYWGDDIRQNDVSSNYTYAKLEDLKEIYPGKDDGELRKKVKEIERYADATIVGDFALLPYSPSSIVVKQAIDLNQWDFIGTNPMASRIKVVHAPSNRKIKGTDYIINAINKLRENGYDIDFVLLENMDNIQVRTHCKEADIIVDQLLLESYGIFAIECMALGKPVLCRIDAHFIKCYSDLPIVVTDPETLYDNLERLIKDAKLRRDLGEKGRRFVEKVHDSREIARQLVDLYRSL